MRHFKLAEFDCPCCGKNRMNYLFTERLDQAREYAGIPFIVNSGYRCEKHNEKVGGLSNSSHLTGSAADIKCIDSQSRFLILDALFHVGFSRIGIYFKRGMIHVDDDHSKPRAVVWGKHD